MFLIDSNDLSNNILSNSKLFVEDVSLFFVVHNQNYLSGLVMFTCKYYNTAQMSLTFDSSSSQQADQKPPAGLPTK